MCDKSLISLSSKNNKNYHFKVVIIKGYCLVWYYQIAKSSMSIPSDFVLKSSQNNPVAHLQQLILNNFEVGDKFIGLTVADSNLASNLDKLNKHREYFIKKLNQRRGEFKYIFVPEYTERGFHFHMVCNFDYIDQKQLQDMWGIGIVHIKKIYNLFGGASYITKYLTKSKIKLGNRRYYCSKNIERPYILHGKPASDIVEGLVSTGELPVHNQSYHSPFNGRIYFSIYKIPDLSAL